MCLNLELIYIQKTEISADEKVYWQHQAWRSCVANKKVFKLDIRTKSGFCISVLNRDWNNESLYFPSFFLLILVFWEKGSFGQSRRLGNSPVEGSLLPWRLFPLLVSLSHWMIQTSLAGRPPHPSHGTAPGLNMCDCALPATFSCLVLYSYPMTFFLHVVTSPPLAWFSGSFSLLSCILDTCQVTQPHTTVPAAHACLVKKGILLYLGNIPSQRLSSPAILEYLTWLTNPFVSGNTKTVLHVLYYPISPPSSLFLPREEHAYSSQRDQLKIPWVKSHFLFGLK